MAKMTPEDLARLPKGTVLLNKCDNCGKPLGAFLTYRGTNGREYCSNSCYEVAEGAFRGKHQPRSPIMIEPKKKAAAPAAETTKADPKKTPQNKADAPKADKVEPKKGKVEPKKDKAEPKKDKAEPKKDKKEPKAKGDTPYRAGSNFERLFKRLMDGKPKTQDQLAEGLDAGDPGRMLAHMMRRGDETKAFKIERKDDGKYVMTKAYKG